MLRTWSAVSSRSLVTRAGVLSTSFQQERYGTHLASGNRAAGAPPRTRHGFSLASRDKKRQKKRDVKHRRALIKEAYELRKMGVGSAEKKPAPELSEEEMEELRIMKEEEEEEGNADYDPVTPEEMEEDRKMAELTIAELEKLYPDAVTIDDDELETEQKARRNELEKMVREAEDQYQEAVSELEEEHESSNDVEPLFEPKELIAKLKSVKSVDELINVDLGFSADQYKQMLEEDHAEDVVVLDVEKKCNFAKSIIVAHTHSQRHRVAMAEKLRTQIRKRRQLLMPHMIEEGKMLLTGRQQPLPAEAARDWIVVDGDNVVVNLFSPEKRAYYDLEALWTEEAEAILSDEEMMNDIADNYNVKEKKRGKGGKRKR